MPAVAGKFETFRCRRLSVDSPRTGVVDVEMTSGDASVQHPKLIAFHKIGENRGSPRLWLESKRLATIGFEVGKAFTAEILSDTIRFRVSAKGAHHVSQRRVADGVRPIIDVVNRTILASITKWDEVRIAGSLGLIDITPSVRGFAIRRQRESHAPWRTLEVFCGGGTLSAAISGHPDFRLIAGVEIEPRFADVWQSAHRNAVLIQADIRKIHPSEFPSHEILIASLPCTSHSLLGRAKKSLGQKPELGDSGDLFLSVAALIATHLPLACIFENVPSFATALAGQTLAQHLQHLGYYVTQTILDPHKQWAEPQD
ncbi:MAG TPA: DNA cytosine methyltransferase, partial [Chthoniobacterales bacterium]|nr:DNA cytosine methyltransferase [Chthoniobacterales bacterium]